MFTPLRFSNRCVFVLAICLLGTASCQTAPAPEAPSADSGVLGYSQDGKTIILYDAQRDTAFYVKPEVTVGIGSNAELMRFFFADGSAVDVRPFPGSRGANAIVEIRTPGAANTKIFQLVDDGGSYRLEQLADNPLTAKLRNAAAGLSESCISAYIEHQEEGLTCVQNKAENLYKDFLSTVGSAMEEVADLVPTDLARAAWNKVSSFFQNEDNVADGVLFRPETVRSPSETFVDQVKAALDMEEFVQTYRAAFSNVKPGDNPVTDAAVRSTSDILRGIVERVEQENKASPCPPGMILWSDGSCRTPSGCPLDAPYLWSNGTCNSYPEPPSCPPGTTLAPDGTCRNAQGCTLDYPYAWSDGFCHNTPEPPPGGCGFGYSPAINQSNICCPDGYLYYWADGRCHSQSPLDYALQNGCPPSGWVECTCPDLHWCVSVICNGIYYHTDGMSCAEALCE